MHSSDMFRLCKQTTQLSATGIPVTLALPSFLFPVRLTVKFKLSTVVSSKIAASSWLPSQGCALLVPAHLLLQAGLP